jgi:hypothetical protein
VTRGKFLFTSINNSSANAAAVASANSAWPSPSGASLPASINPFSINNINNSSMNTNLLSLSQYAPLYDTYEQRNYINFLDSSFNNMSTAQMNLSSISEIYDHANLKKEIRQLVAEKESLLTDIKKSLIFNYFYDHSELVTLANMQNSLPGDGSNKPNDASAGNKDKNRDDSSSSPITGIAGSNNVNRDNNVGSKTNLNALYGGGGGGGGSGMKDNMNASSSMDFLHSRGGISSSTSAHHSTSHHPSMTKTILVDPIYHDPTKGGKQAATAAANKQKPVSNSKTTTSSSSSSSSSADSVVTHPSKSDKTDYRHVINLYAVQNTDSLKFLYLISKLVSGKTILKAKKANNNLSAKSGEYLTKVYNLRMKTVNQCNYELQNYDLYIKEFSKMNNLLADKIQSYFQELKKIDYQIIKQSQQKLLNEKMMKKETFLKSDKEKLKIMNDKLKAIIKTAIIDIKYIYNNTNSSHHHHHHNQHNTTRSQSPLKAGSSSSPTKGSSINGLTEEQMKEAELSQSLVSKNITNTVQELTLFSSEITEKMDSWYALTLKSLEKKKSLLDSLSSPVITTKKEGTREEKGENNNHDDDTNNLSEQYSSAKSTIEDHCHSIQTVHSLNQEIRERIIQESEKNHTKYDYYLKLQQNQFQSKFQIKR